MRRKIQALKFLSNEFLTNTSAVLYSGPLFSETPKKPEVTLMQFLDVQYIMPHLCYAKTRINRPHTATRA